MVEPAVGCGGHALVAGIARAAIPHDLESLPLAAQAPVEPVAAAGADAGPFEDVLYEPYPELDLTS